MFSVGICGLNVLPFLYHIHRNIYCGGIACYDYQSAYCQKLAEFSRG